MKKTVLIVEDDSHISSLLRDYFSGEYNVVEAQNGAQALIEFEKENAGLIILDVMLPILDGWDVCKAIRARSKVPIIMLTAKSDEQSSLKGFDLGVDDYMAKPFSPKVLLAKARAIFNRIEHADNEPNRVYAFGDHFVLNEPSHKVIVCGENVNLTATEFAILAILVKNNGMVITRDAILDSVWGINYFGDYRIVDTNIKRIREKIFPKSDFIKTVRGMGYKFEVE